MFIIGLDENLWKINNIIVLMREEYFVVESHSNYGYDTKRAAD